MLPPIHVLLAGGHPVLLGALAEMTARLPGVVVAGAVATVSELLARLAHIPAGVVLLDADLPPAGGLETTRWLKAAHPTIPVLLLTLDNPLALVKKAVRPGEERGLSVRYRRVSRKDAKEERKDRKEKTRKGCVRARDFALTSGNTRIAGRCRIAGSRRIAAPLLGGVRGWVYLRETSYRGGTARETRAIRYLHQGVSAES